MVAYHTEPHHVKQNNGFLKINQNNQPEVEFNGTSAVLPDVPWSRWYLRACFKHLTATEQAQAWYAQHDPLKLPPIPGLQVSLWNNQKLGVNRMLFSNSCLFKDMGCGKTGCSIAFSLILYNKGLNYFLVISPPTVFITWIDEIAKFIDPALHTETYIVHGPKKHKTLSELRTNSSKNPKFILTSYETLDNVRQALQTLPISVAFFDESSKVKNWEAKRTQTCHNFINSKPDIKRFCLSGTPSTKSCLGLFSQFELLGPGLSGHQSYISFEKRYAVSKLFAMVRLPHGKITRIDADDTSETFPRWLNEHNLPNSNVSYAELGYSFSQRPQGEKQIKILNLHKEQIKFINQDELHATTQRLAYTVYKDEIFDLPPKTYVKRTLEMPEEQRKAYHELLETNRTVLASTPFSFHHSSPYAKLHQIANGYCLNQDGSIHFFASQPKLTELEEIIEEAGDQKIIIWSTFRPQIAQAVNFIEQSLELETLELHGGVPNEKRKDVVHRFQDENGPSILVCNPEVGGMGLNLTCASLAVFMSNWFQPDVRKQAEDREHRPGQTKPVTIIDLLMRGTLEAGILRNTLKEINSERSILSMSILKGE